MPFPSSPQSESRRDRSDRCGTRPRLRHVMLRQAWLDPILKLCRSTVVSVVYGIVRRSPKRQRQRQRQGPTAATMFEHACYSNPQRPPFVGPKLFAQQLHVAKPTRRHKRDLAHTTPKAVAQDEKEEEEEEEESSQGTASTCVLSYSVGPCGVQRLPSPASDLSDDVLITTQLCRDQLDEKRERIAATRRAIVRQQKLVDKCIMRGSTRRVKEAKYQKQQLDLALKLQCDRILELEGSLQGAEDVL